MRRCEAPVHSQNSFITLSLEVCVSFKHPTKPRTVSHLLKKSSSHYL